MDLESLVHEATHTGKRSFDKIYFMRIEAECKVSKDKCGQCIEFLFESLRTNHSQVRLLSLLLIGELVKKSKFMRMLVAKRIHDLTELSVALPSNKCLPPPENFAKLLHKKSLEMIEEWNFLYGEQMQEISHCYRFLSTKINFPNVRGELEYEERRQKEREERESNLLKEKFRSLCENFINSADLIEYDVTQIETCLEILVPRVEQLFKEGFSAPERTDSWVVNDSSFGLDSISVPVELPLKHDISSNSSAIHENLQELYPILKNRYSVELDGWLDTLERIEVLEPEKLSLRLEFLDRARALKQRVTKVKKQCDLAKVDEWIIPRERVESDDDEFEYEDLDDNSEVSKEEQETLPSLEKGQYHGSKGVEVFSEKDFTVETPKQIRVLSKPSVFPNSGMQVQHRIYGGREGEREIPDYRVQELLGVVTYYEPPSCQTNLLEKEEKSSTVVKKLGDERSFKRRRKTRHGGVVPLSVASDTRKKRMERAVKRGGQLHPPVIIDEQRYDRFSNNVTRAWKQA